MTTEKSYWSQTIQIGTHSVYAWERNERHGHIFIKFTDHRRSGSDRRAKMKVPGDLRVRNAKGAIEQKLVRVVLRRIEQLADQLFFGEAPSGAKPREMTLSEGFDRVLDFDVGKYPTKTRRWDEVARAARRLCVLLGKQKPWTEVGPGDVRGIWRRLAKEYMRGNPSQPRCGARQAEVTVDALYATAAWLRDEGLLPADTLLPTTKWRSRLKSDWKEIVGESVEPRRPRHTQEEMRRLFENMRRPEVDPRFALAFDVGGEQRLGQVLRCKRSQLDLTPVDVSQISVLEPGQLGSLKVEGSGQKRASIIFLTSEQRLAVESALSGYLADYETAFIRGEVDDYPVFPSGRLKAGRAKLSPAPQALTRDAALKMFRRLEEVAGVSRIKDRGWYGVRRVATDVAEDLVRDERVLNSLTGHRDSTTRRMIYQDHERKEVLVEAAKVRRAIRGRGTTVVARDVATSVA